MREPATRARPYRSDQPGARQRNVRLMGLSACGLIGLTVLSTTHLASLELPAIALPTATLAEAPELIAMHSSPVPPPQRAVCPDHESWIQVREAGTDAPIPGVAVEMISPKGDTYEVLLTDEAGRVELPEGRAPRGGLLCRKAGYRLAGISHLRDGPTIHLVPERELAVELINVPPAVRGMQLSLAVRYSRPLGAAHLVGNPRVWYRLDDLTPRVPITSDRVLLPVAIAADCKVEVMARHRHGSEYRMASVNVGCSHDGPVTIDLGGTSVETLRVRPVGVNIDPPNRADTPASEGCRFGDFEVGTPNFTGSHPASSTLTIGPTRVTFTRAASR